MGWGLNISKSFSKIGARRQREEKGERIGERGEERNWKNNLLRM